MGHLERVLSGHNLPLRAERSLAFLRVSELAYRARVGKAGKHSPLSMASALIRFVAEIVGVPFSDLLHD